MSDIQAKITKCWSRVFFHDTETTSACFSLTATLSGKESILRQIATVCAGSNVARLDFDNNKVDIDGSHRDPLYLFECRGEVGIEVNLYQEIPDDELLVIHLANGGHRTLSPEIKAEWDIAPDSILISHVISSELDSIAVMMQCDHETEVVYQMTHNGVFREERARFRAGRNVVRFPPEYLAGNALDYVGLSLNTTLPDGSDIEHKHVFLGRL